MALPPYKHPLQATDVAVGYGARSILKGVGLRVAPAEIRVILGASGCGKSTLLKALVGLLPVSQGQVQLLGVDLARADEATLEAALAKVGMLFQNGALINSLSVLDNVAFPLHQRTTLPAELIREVAAMKLALVGMQDAALLMPPELSGGMKKRAALARALALDPDILLCDEPSAGLDPNSAADLDALILSLRDQFGMAVVVVSHELASIEAIADTVTMLADGQVLAEGPLPTVSRMRHPRVRAFFDRSARPPGQRGATVVDLLGLGSGP